MIDCPLYRHAMRSNQSGGRGWHFPNQEESEFRRPTFLLALAAVGIAVALVAVWLT